MVTYLVLFQRKRNGCGLSVAESMNCPECQRGQLGKQFGVRRDPSRPRASTTAH